MKVPAAWQNGRVVFAQTADKQCGEFTCLGCGGLLTLKRGLIRVPHFAHLPDAVCSESVMHRVCKEWISSLGSRTDFRVMAKCGCGRTHTVLRGGALIGRCEVSCRPYGNLYRMDVCFADQDGRVVGCVEVRHTHAAGVQKLREIEASHPWSLPAVEVNTVDLVEENFPTVFTSVHTRICVLCVRARLRKRLAHVETAREALVLRYGRLWLRNAEVLRIARVRKAWRVWVLHTRLRKLSEMAKELFELEQEKRIKACFGCKNPVVLYTWKHDSRTERPHVAHDNQYWHRKCCPVCYKCGEPKSTKYRFCECDKKRRRPCIQCGEWDWKETLFCFSAPKNDWCFVHKNCSVECRLCDTRISFDQAIYGGKCYSCNRKRKFYDD